MKTRLIIIGAIALFLLIAAVAVQTSNLEYGGLPAGLWIAYAIGALLTVLVGGGLFALTFYSARNGYDEIDHSEDSF